MERLTIRKSDGAWHVPLRDDDGVYIPSQKIIDRLAAYEDTGLEPEICAEYKKFEDEAVGKNVPFNRIVELMNAEAEGRLMVLPRGEVGLAPKKMMLGERVWFLFYDDDTRQWEIAQERITGVGIEGFWCSGLTNQPDAATYMTKWDEVGERAFLSERDAEKARKEANAQ